LLPVSPHRGLAQESFAKCRARRVPNLEQSRLLFVPNLEQTRVPHLEQVFAHFSNGEQAHVCVQTLEQATCRLFQSWNKRCVSCFKFGTCVICKNHMFNDGLHVITHRCSTRLFQIWNKPLHLCSEFGTRVSTTTFGTSTGAFCFKFETSVFLCPHLCTLIWNQHLFQTWNTCLRVCCNCGTGACTFVPN
jgi:hypothetical protein